METEFKNGQSAAKLLNPKGHDESSTTSSCCGNVPFVFNQVNWEAVDTTKNTCYIYVLAHPITHEVRYIGLSIDLKRRYIAHCCTTTKSHYNNWRHNWVKNIKKKSMKPLIGIVEAIKKSDFTSEEPWFQYCDNREGELISLFLGNKYRLLNYDKVLAVGRKYAPNSEHIDKKKKLYQYDKNGVFLREWESLKAAAEELNTKTAILSNACSRKNKSCGFYWSIQKLDHFEIRLDWRLKECHQYTSDGKYFTSYVSIKEASEKTGINRNSIKACMYGTQISAGGFIFSFILGETIECRQRKNAVVKI